MCIEAAGDVIIHPFMKGLNKAHRISIVLTGISRSGLRSSKLLLHSTHKSLEYDAPYFGLSLKLDCRPDVHWVCLTTCQIWLVAPCMCVHDTVHVSSKLVWVVVTNITSGNDKSN